MEAAELLMNPVRQRIFQYLLVHETATVKEIRKALPDVPGASLYRHVKLLAENGILTLAAEHRIRGTVESVYRLDKSALAVDDADGAAVQSVLLGVSSAFARYFSDDAPDPKRDMLSVSACTLRLNDEAFANFLSEINRVAVKYMDAPVNEDAKTRQILLISAPTDGQAD